MITTPTYNQLVTEFTGEIYLAGGCKEWEAATFAPIRSRIDELDKIYPECENTKSKMELFRDKAGVPTTEKNILVNIHSGETERWYWGWKRRSDASDFIEVENDQVNNFIWNDIIEVAGVKGSYTEQKKILFHSYAFDKKFKMMVKEFYPHAKKMVRGSLVGRFTFIKTGGYLGLRMVS